MKIIDKKLTEIKPYEQNPRKNDEAVDKVAASIKEFGFKQPIVIDGDGIIIVGHTRYKAAQKLGLKTVPVLVADDLSEEQAKAYRLADNKTNEFAEWDFELLDLELFDVGDIDMEQFGFNAVIFEDDKTDTIEEVDIPEEAEARCKLGDTWQLGKHRLICGDSTNAKTVEVLMGGVLADMVFTDPPWNVNYGAVKENNPQGYKPRTIKNDFMGTEEFKEFMRSAFSCMNSASKPGAMTYVVMSAQEWGNMMLMLAANDYHWSSTIIWNKDHLVLSRKDYHTKYEPIWYGWKGGEKRLCPLEDRTQSDVWDFNRPIKSDEHPTMKPVSLVARAISNSSHSGDCVLDLFGGSGTTLIACEQLERICYMCELDEHYCDVIINRWETLTGQKAELITA